MKTRNMLHKTKVFLIIFISILFSVIVGFLFNHNLKGIESTLDSIILFVSIIIGFIGASLSVFATVSESKFASKLKNSPNSKKQFISTLSSSLVIGVILVMLTIVYQLLISNESPILFLKIINYAWLFLIPLFLGLCYLIISVILKILFSN